MSSNANTTAGSGNNGSNGNGNGNNGNNGNSNNGNNGNGNGNGNTGNQTTNNALPAATATPNVTTPQAGPTQDQAGGQTPTTSRTTQPQASPSVVFVTITSQQPDNVDNNPVVVTQVSTIPFTAPSSSTRPTSSNTGTATAVPQSSNSSGLSTGATIGIAVAVPVVVLALLGGLGFLFWRRRKRNRNDMAMRKAEADAYSFDPNAGGAAAGGGAAAAAMTQGEGGYRGWGSTQGAGSTTTPGMFQPGRGGDFGAATAAGVGAGALAGGAALAGRRPSGRSRLEEPTVPAFAQDDLDSVAPTSPRHSTMLSSQGPGYPLDEPGQEQLMPEHHGSAHSSEPLVTGAGMAGAGAAMGAGAAAATMPSGPRRRQQYPDDPYGGRRSGSYNLPAAPAGPGQPSARAPYPITEPSSGTQPGTGRMSAFLPPLQSSNNQRTPSIVHSNGEPDRRFSYAENF